MLCALPCPRPGEVHRQYSSNRCPLSLLEEALTCPFHSFRLSAKTGAGVQQCFFRVAADLAGILLPKTERQGHGSTNHMPGESSKNPVAELPPMNSVQSGAKGCTKTEGAEEIADALPSERPLAQRGPGRLARNEAKGRLKDGQRCVIM